MCRMTCIYYGDIASMERLPCLLFSALHKGTNKAYDGMINCKIDK